MKHRRSIGTLAGVHVTQPSPRAQRRDAAEHMVGRPVGQRHGLGRARTEAIGAGDVPTLPDQFNQFRECSRWIRVICVDRHDDGLLGRRQCEVKGGTEAASRFADDGRAGAARDLRRGVVASVDDEHPCTWQRGLGVADHLLYRAFFVAGDHHNGHVRIRA